MNDENTETAGRTGVGRRAVPIASDGAAMVTGAEYAVTAGDSAHDLRRSDPIRRSKPKIRARRAAQASRRAIRPLIVPSSSPG